MLKSSETDHDICFYEAFEEEAEALKKYLPPNIKAYFTWKTIQESGHNGPNAPIISTRTQSILPTEWEGKLSAILSRSTGYDHLLRYKEETNTNIHLGYLPLYCNRAVAEQAMLLWMSLLRKLSLQQQKFSTFNRDGLTGYECENKTLLVVGVGNIGYQVVKIGNGLGMQVLGVDIIEKHSDVHYANIDNAISKADIIVCAMNLTMENIGYFDYKRLSKSKRGIVFINIARGEMSPIDDLLQLIQENHFGGIALDVYENEKDLAHVLRGQEKSQNPKLKALIKLSEFPNVILTPHNAFNTVESVERKAEQSIQQLNYFLKNGTFLWPAPIG